MVELSWEHWVHSRITPWLKFQFIRTLLYFWEICCHLIFLKDVGCVSHHRVAEDEDGQVGVACSHQVDVLQTVSDVDLKVFNIHPLPFALPMAHCENKREREYVDPNFIRGIK